VSCGRELLDHNIALNERHFTRSRVLLLRRLNASGTTLTRISILISQLGPNPVRVVADVKIELRHDIRCEKAPQGIPKVIRAVFLAFNVSFFPESICYQNAMTIVGA